MQEVSRRHLLNMCRTLFMRAKLFKSPTYKRGKSSSALAHMHNPAHKEECAGRCGWRPGLSEPQICNSRPNPGVRPSETRGGHFSRIDLFGFSQRKRAEGKGRSKMETLAPHYSVSWRRADIGSPPNWLWSLYSAQRVVETLPRWWMWARAGVSVIKVCEIYLCRAKEASYTGCSSYKPKMP